MCKTMHTKKRKYTKRELKIINGRCVLVNFIIFMKDLKLKKNPIKYCGFYCNNLVKVYEKLFENEFLLDSDRQISNMNNLKTNENCFLSISRNQVESTRIRKSEHVHELFVCCLLSSCPTFSHLAISLQT